MHTHCNTCNVKGGYQHSWWDGCAHIKGKFAIEKCGNPRCVWIVVEKTKEGN